MCLRIVSICAIFAHLKIYFWKKCQISIISFLMIKTNMHIVYVPNRCPKTNAQSWFPNSERALWPIQCRRAPPTCPGCSRDETKLFHRWTLFAAASAPCPIANWMFCTCLRRNGICPMAAMTPMSDVCCNTVCRRSHFGCNYKMLHFSHANWMMICPVMWSTYLPLNITEWGPCRPAFKK